MALKWDFGDGSTSTQPGPRHRYAGPGQYAVQLTATDAGGLKGTQTRQVIVQDPSGPAAALSFAPMVPLVGQVVTFTDTSTPSSGQLIASREWDLDNDGDFDDSPVGWSFGAPGNHVVSLLVTQSNDKPALKRRPCLIPADGFYEWMKVPGAKRKQPYFIHRPDDEPFAFAGLWEVWKGPKDAEGNRSGDPLRSCTIITTTPNETMAKIHDRMPVILPPSAWDEWLDPDNDDIETLGKLLVPAPASLTELRPVSTEVNNVRNKGAGLSAEIPADQIIVADSTDT